MTRIQRVWSAAPVTYLPEPLYYFASGVIGNKIYVVGGYNGTYSKTLRAYDTITGLWETMAQMPTGRSYLEAAVLNGKLYAMGGLISATVVPTTAVEKYDPDTNTRTTVTSLNTSRRAFGSAVVNGRIYALNGVITSNWAVTDILEEYTQP
ncbi:MAG: hypothetical protein K6U80_09730 [Firmicutes bacterium]|nr:hypothetical protein [Bacillota bacterium]